MNAQLHRIPGFRTRLTPLSPVSHPDAATDPVTQITVALVVGGDTKAVNPTTDKLADFE